jgi:sugar-specific transcriptional regulator TrmB
LVAHGNTSKLSGDAGQVQDILAALQELGFTEYEAKVYCALISHPGVSGYGTGKYSGVPRARVYEVLEGLVHKGAAVVHSEGGRMLYYPLDHRTMIRDRRERLARTADALEAGLDRVASRSPDPEFLVFRGREAVMSRCRHLIASSMSKLYLAGWPEDLSALGRDLHEAEKRGVDVYVMSFGEAELPVKKVFYHYVSPLQYLQVAVHGRWLQAVADLESCLMAQMAGPEQTVGIWTRARAAVTSVAEGTYHNIMAIVLAEGLQAQELPPDLLESKRAVDQMLAWGPQDAKVELPANTPGVDAVLDSIRKRLEAAPGLARDIGGSYEFRLAGSEGGVYHVDLRKGLIEVGRGPVEDPGLVLAMQADDFRAMVAGVLPLGALYAPGRIKVSGDVVLAGRLQALLLG